MGERLWKLARRTLPFGGRTLVMGILNVTPDSFSDGGHFLDAARALEHGARMAEVVESLGRSVEEALRRGVAREATAVDPGIGFGKSQEQNVEPRY